MGPGCVVSPCKKKFSVALSPDDSYEMLLKLIKAGMETTFYEPVSETTIYANPIDILLAEAKITKTFANTYQLSAADYLECFGIKPSVKDSDRGWIMECIREVGENILDFDNILTTDGFYYIRPTRIPCDGYLGCFDS